MKFNYLILVMSLSIGLLSCSVSRESARQQPRQMVSPDLYATLYQQYAAEYKALCFQAYNLASLRLEQALTENYSKPTAIVLDIDETVLDNIPYQAAAIKGGFGYPVQWAEWMESANAEPLAGVTEFLQLAANTGVNIFYVSNRKEVFKEATIRNLQAKGLPFADEAHVLLRVSGNEKESRRKSISAEYEIIMLVGDNLGDFDSMFETDADVRMTATLEYAGQFGKKWIVLPNAVYGSWLETMPGYDTKLTKEALTDSLRMQLKGFNE